MYMNSWASVRLLAIQNQSFTPYAHCWVHAYMLATHLIDYLFEINKKGPSKRGPPQLDKIVSKVHACVSHPLNPVIYF